MLARFNGGGSLLLWVVALLKINAVIFLWVKISFSHYCPWNGDSGQVASEGVRTHLLGDRLRFVFLCKRCSASERYLSSAAASSAHSYAHTPSHHSFLFILLQGLTGAISVPRTCFLSGKVRGD